MILESYRQAAQTTIESLPGDSGDWLIPQRQAAVKQMLDLGIPHARQETWRYTSVDGLLSKELRPNHRVSDRPVERLDIAPLEEPVAARLVFVDGSYSPELSTGGSQRGYRLGSLRSAMATGDQSVLRSVASLSGTGDHLFAAMNLACLQDGAVIQLSPGVVIEQPVELLHITTNRKGRHGQQIRHLIELDTDASVKLIERYLSVDDDSDYFNNIVCEISLAEDAEFRHERVQQESDAAYHLCRIHIDLGRNASYRGVTAALGGAWSRTELYNRFSGEGAAFEVDGLYAAGEGQLCDFHLKVDHAVPNCRSREAFKGVLHGAGRAVFDGLIQVKADSQKSEAHLHNANLMLSSRAEVDTKPQLVILADDVQCSHGTSVGQLDEQALFYLRSRGIDGHQARRILCLGFAGEILDRFATVSLREQIENDLLQRMRF
ncbi:MAG: Fe-S cluster assembly protein SufD [gamma proteobacterium symbiont of Ctena orbiculata]|nr:MAG: Fe-S cluster assembly protein SufD [gamma proteobacterium symbiont of Ctena orbiculata]